MFRPRKALLVALVCSLAYLAGSLAFAAPVSLNDLDQIVSRAKDLDSFLADKNLRKEYYQALENYYGKDKFNKEIYQAILDQLKTTTTALPELKKRLWETTNTGSGVVVETKLRTSGREINLQRWREYYEGWSASLRDSQGDLKNLSEEERSRLISSYIAEYQKSYQALNAQLAVLPKAARERKTAEFFKAQRADGRAKQIASYVLDHHLSQESVRDIFFSGDADVVLEEVDGLSQQAKNLIRLPDGVSSIPSPILTSLRGLTPKKGDLLNDYDLFPIITKISRSGERVPVGSGGVREYVFEPIPRRIHGIWKGISLGECVGGGSCENLTPERWATVALKDAQLFHVRQGDSYLGFVQMIPIKKGGDIYASVDFGASVLSRKTFYLNPDTGSMTSAPLFDLWYEKARKKLPKNWKGMIVSNSNAINNAGALETIKNSPKYYLGQNIGGSEELGDFDPLAKKIANFSKKTLKRESPYSGRMIYDAVQKDATQIKKLVNADPKILENTKKIVLGLKNGNEAYRLALLDALNKASTPVNPEVRQVLFTLLEDPNDAVRARAIKYVTSSRCMTEECFQHKIAVFTDPEHPLTNDQSMDVIDQFFQKGIHSDAIRNRVVQIVSTADGFLSKHWVYSEYLIQHGLTPEELDAIGKVARLDHPNGQVLLLSLLVKTQKDRKKLKAVLEENWNLAQDTSSKLHVASGYVAGLGWSDPETEKHVVLAAQNLFDGKSYPFQHRQLMEISRDMPPSEEMRKMLIAAVKKSYGPYSIREEKDLFLRQNFTEDEALSLMGSLIEYPEYLVPIVRAIKRPSIPYVDQIYSNFLKMADNMTEGKEFLVKSIQEMPTDEKAHFYNLISGALDSKLDHQEQQRVLEMLEYDTDAIPLPIQKRITDLLKTSIESSHWPVGEMPAIVERLTLSDPNILRRVKQLAALDKLTADAKGQFATALEEACALEQVSHSLKGP